jgi:hypothetical protein
MPRKPVWADLYIAMIRRRRLLSVCLRSCQQWWKPRRLSRLSNEAVQGVVEIVCTQTLVTISVEEIHNIAFVFPMETNDPHGIILNGLFNGFIIRFRDNGSPVEELVPFPSMHILHKHAKTCYSQRIWTSLEMLRDLLVKALNSYSQHQGDSARKSQKVHFPPEAWEYLSVCSFRRGVSVIASHTRSLRSRLYGPMKASTFRVERTAELLRFETIV